MLRRQQEDENLSIKMKIYQ